ncbi:hypothetical protein EJ05DRAFT_35329 [Pseudovirgaria hyperparasitica]|uniref:Lysine-specific metallo-endopeptidase domain-containing protein n=1 Tax=Pseudovirgaria hyperparasitica TaxID=470096 RepID=A0A6A6WMH1_9PEZI|nr:uncharacterized protein EJ05DRAFT_35329 [Pseudovirgaria hyperparasitica]KAF2763352.1 hypothetical protein EJ05DRAFT_35329 [Pseudovirgaria hyperparasitica]
MVSGTLLAVFALICSPCLAAVHYWVDYDCYAMPMATEAIAEAILMAQRSYDRLSNAANDPDIQILFSRIYHTTINDRRAVEHVRRIMYGIANIKEVLSREESNTIIYCDNDARWQPVPGQATFPGGTQEWFDVNDPHFRFVGRPSCKDGSTSAVTYKAPNHHPLFSTGLAQVTICNIGVSRTRSTIAHHDYFDWSLGSLMYNPEWSSMNPYDTASVTVLHEFTHLPDFGILDVPPDPYWWHNIIRKPTGQALMNADNYAFFGLLAHLGDYGFKLSDREWKAGVITRSTYRPGGRPR